MKASESIHFSRTSQPPRFTPRRKGIFALAVGVTEGAVVEDGIEVVVGFAMTEEMVEGMAGTEAEVECVSEDDERTVGNGREAVV